MDDERLLSEALRAHAAGGVSTPRPAPAADPSATPASGDAEDPSKRRRFRPLGRARRAPDTTDAPTTVQPAPLRGTHTDTPRPGIPRSDVPAPRSGGPAAPPPGARPVHPPAARLPAPGRPGPSSGPDGVPTGAYGPPPGGGRPAGPPATAPEGPGAWDAATVAWWGAVALLAGGSVGSAVAVLSLLLPA
ncbi:hypothetical protein [Actinomycetospora atypica]|uniref:Uncharacterized protein n=1 Tax=Actinomycetospora atypica TaxID=1290095 RepID=A0ABV9YGN9_9PSEU